MREQRRFERVSSRIRCWCEGENVTFYARIGNLSEGGLFLRTLTPLPLGARARLRLQVGESELVAPVSVVWVRGNDAAGPPGMGLAFEALDAATQARIRGLIARERSSSLARATALVVGPAGV